MRNISYDWVCGIDHSWLATDECGHIAYVQCPFYSMLPRSKVLDEDYIIGLDERLKEVARSFFRKNGDLFEEDVGIEKIGVFVYDADLDSKRFKCVAVPKIALKIKDLPPSMQFVANLFKINKGCFSSCKELEMNIFDSTDETIARKAIEVTPLRFGKWPETVFIDGALCHSGVIKLMPNRYIDENVYVNIPTHLSWKEYKTIIISILKRVMIGTSTLKVQVVRGKNCIFDSIDDYGRAILFNAETVIGDKVFFYGKKGVMITITISSHDKCASCVEEIDMFVDSSKCVMKYITRTVLQVCKEKKVNCHYARVKYLSYLCHHLISPLRSLWRTRRRRTFAWNAPKSIS